MGGVRSRFASANIGSLAERLALALSLSLLAACGSADQGPLGPSDSSTVAPKGPFTPGSTYFGASRYIEYIAGNLPIIVSAAHGGSILPGEIPERVAAQCGGEATTVRDTNTEELAREISGAFLPLRGGTRTS